MKIGDFVSFRLAAGHSRIYGFVVHEVKAVDPNTFEPSTRYYVRSTEGGSYYLGSTPGVVSTTEQKIYTREEWFDEIPAECLLSMHPVFRSILDGTYQERRI